MCTNAIAVSIEPHTFKYNMLCNGHFKILRYRGKTAPYRGNSSIPTSLRAMFSKQKVTKNENAVYLKHLGLQRVKLHCVVESATCLGNCDLDMDFQA